MAGYPPAARPRAAPAPRHRASAPPVNYAALPGNAELTTHHLYVKVLPASTNPADRAATKLTNDTLTYMLEIRATLQAMGVVIAAERVTPAMLASPAVQAAFAQRGITRLPALVVDGAVYQGLQEICDACTLAIREAQQYARRAEPGAGDAYDPTQDEVSRYYSHEMTEAARAKELEADGPEGEERIDATPDLMRKFDSARKRREVAYAGYRGNRGAPAPDPAAEPRPARGPPARRAPERPDNIRGGERPRDHREPEQRDDDDDGAAQTAELLRSLGSSTGGHGGSFGGRAPIAATDFDPDEEADPEGERMAQQWLETKNSETVL